jgi:CheY-like chemotaxis protein
MARSDQPDRPPLRVLLIEDDRDTADSLALLLCLEGHVAQTAPDGPAGLAAFQAGLPDVVLIDIDLPGGMDGWEVARRLREQFSGRRVVLIAVTGYGRDQDHGRSEAAGFDFHFLKPADPEFLVRLLRSYAGHGKAGSQPGGGDQGPAAAKGM